MQDIVTCILLHIATSQIHQDQYKLITEPLQLHCSTSDSQLWRFVCLIISHTRPSNFNHLSLWQQDHLSKASIALLHPVRNSHLPPRRWKLDISGLHLSIKVIINGWSSRTQLNWEWMKNPAPLTQSITQGSFKIHLLYAQEWSTQSMTRRSWNYKKKI